MTATELESLRHYTRTVEEHAADAEEECARLGEQLATARTAFREAAATLGLVLDSTDADGLRRQRVLRELHCALLAGAEEPEPPADALAQSAAIEEPKP